MFSRARQLLERARGMVRDDVDLLARIDLSLALVRSETGESRQALELLRDVAARPGIEAETQGLVHSQVALIHMLRGDNDEALTWFRSAIGALTDDLPLGRAHLNRGGVYLQQGRTREAMDDFELAGARFTAAGDASSAAMAIHNLGYIQLLVGELAAALKSMNQAYAVLAQESPVVRATCEQDRAEVLIAAGLVTEGRAALVEAARAYSSRRLHQRRGDAMLALARTLVLADPAEALASARLAGRLYDRVGSDAWRVRADAVALAAEVELGRKGPSLISRGDSIADALDDQGLVSAAALVRLHTARVHVRRGLLDDAGARIRRVRLGSSSPLGVRLLARTARTELATAQGRRSSALQQVRAGVSDLHAWQSTFGSLDLQTAVVGQGRRLAVLGLGLAVDADDPAVLYEWSERGRMLASRILPVRPPVDDQSAADLAELRQLQAGGDDVKVPRPRREAELRRRVRERAWHSPGSGEVTEPAPLDDVRRGLGADTALVAWVISDDRVVGLVVTDEGEWVTELGSFARVRTLLAGLLPDLDMAASKLPDGLADVVRQGLSARLESLSDLLVAPLLDHLGDRCVVATPSGGLAGTPWSLLPGLVGRPLTVAGSATAWLGARRQPLGLTRVGLVAGPRVPRAVEEVTAVARRWAGARVLTGEDATAKEVTALAGQVDILHVAAHGRHSAENPLFSGLELADGPWFGYDIDALPNVPAVVLLSACEVGRSSVRFGEELIGMTAAWLHAGARCVIASPTAVADDAAHDVLTQLHAGLAAGLDPAAALAAAVAKGASSGAGSGSAGSGSAGSGSAGSGSAGSGSAVAPFVCFGAAW
ncbi:CHAT domain-containing protein [Nocardioides sp. JQ2195]|uniref:CHAT domain-containing protein n=1 Tax=Nocardioides sp. JQ2195 TaxID=2592334 RepID=UPI00143E761B|nr:CHAT domain-containing protein [Nocardioides sp. JQ2195]QIX28486.1 CHAT domain-containing protein [Nocardioides sp. JQ2195]